MKYLKQLTFVMLLALVWSCSNDDDTVINPLPQYENRIDIGNYAFYFPDDFSLEPLQGIDSYIGRINGTDVSLFFDYGWYTTPAENLNPSEFTITEENINGHYRQIVQPVDPTADYTQIHLYNISEQSNSPQAYNSLTMTTNNLSQAQQDIIIEVFNTVQIIN